MRLLATVTVVGLVVLVALIWFFMRTRQQDLIDEMMDEAQGVLEARHRARTTSKGWRRSRSPCRSTDDCDLLREPRPRGSFDLPQIEEVEYDDELATGQAVDAGCRALRLRSHGHTFEFVLRPAGSPAVAGGAAARIGGRAARRSAV